MDVREYEIKFINPENNKKLEEEIKNILLNNEEIKKTSYLSDSFWANNMSKTIGLSDYYTFDYYKENYSILEKIIYDITVINFNNINLKMSEDITIEFWLQDEFVNHNNFMHKDHSEFDLKYNNLFVNPFLSSIFYLNNSVYPTVIIDKQRKELCFSFPKTNKLISFNGGDNFHGSCNIFNKNSMLDNSNSKRYTLVINYWNKNVTRRPFLIKKNNATSIYKKENDITTINSDLKTNIFIKDETVLTEDFFDEISDDSKTKVTSYYKFQELLNSKLLDTDNVFIPYK
jgi:hypothetical protein